MSSMFLKGYRFFGGAISFYRVLLFSAPSFTFICHRGSGRGSTSSSRSSSSSSRNSSSSSSSRSSSSSSRSSSSSSNNFNASKHLLLKRLWPSHRASLLSRGQFSTNGYR